MNIEGKLRRSMYVCLAIAVVAMLSTANAWAGIIFDDGPTDGNGNAFFITGPNNPNVLGSFQDISNGFIATASGTPNSVTFGEWLFSGLVPTTISYEIGTTAFGTELGSGTVALGPSNLQLLFTNGFGFDIYQITIPVTSAAMTSGGSYWLSLSNADDAFTSGSEAWDIANGGLGGPAVCNFRQSGTNFGDCGLGGESFTIYSSSGTVPEPGSILLLGSGIVGLAGMLRRKLGR